MIVKFIDKPGSKKTEPDFRLGRQYVVLSIDVGMSNLPPMLLINDEDYEYPGLVEIDKFEILDDNFPDFWCITPLKSGAYSLGPREIQGKFWDRLYEDDQEALETMQKVIEKTEAFHQQTK